MVGLNNESAPQNVQLRGPEPTGDDERTPTTKHNPQTRRPNETHDPEIGSLLRTPRRDGKPRMHPVTFRERDGPTLEAFDVWTGRTVSLPKVPSGTDLASSYRQSRPILTLVSGHDRYGNTHSSRSLRDPVEGSLWDICFVYTSLLGDLCRHHPSHPLVRSRRGPPRPPRGPPKTRRRRRK